MPPSARAWHELLAVCFVGDAPDPSPTVADVVDRFLAWSRTHHKPSTFEFYEWFGLELREWCGGRPVAGLRPIDITDWTAARDWTGAHEYNGRRSAFRFLNWAKEEGLIESNPLAGMPRPSPPPRQRALGHDEYLALIRAADSDLRPMLFAMRQTGARPQEVRELVWSQVRPDRLVLPDHKTVRKTRRARVIHLSPLMQRFFAARLAKRLPGLDHVFINARGAPWTRNALRLRIARMRRRLGLADDVVAYLIRHAFGTNAVLNGVDVATVAELMGHASTEITTSVYVHLAGEASHLQAAAARAGRPAALNSGVPACRSMR